MAGVPLVLGIALWQADALAIVVMVAVFAPAALLTYRLSLGLAQWLARLSERPFTPDRRFRRVAAAASAGAFILALVVGLVALFVVYAPRT